MQSECNLRNNAIVNRKNFKICRMSNFFQKLRSVFSSKLSVAIAQKDSTIEAFDRLAKVVSEYESMNNILLAQLDKTSQIHKRHVECSNSLVADNFALRETLFKSQMYCKILEGDLRLVNPDAPSLDMKVIQPILDHAAKVSLAAIDKEVSESSKETKEVLDRISQSSKL